MFLCLAGLRREVEMKIGDYQTGTPAEPGIYVVRMKWGRADMWAYFDGRAFSSAEESAAAAGAMAAQLVDGRLPDKWISRKQVAKWRKVTSDQTFAEIMNDQP